MSHTIKHIPAAGIAALSLFSTVAAFATLGAATKSAAPTQSPDLHAFDCADIKTLQFNVHVTEENRPQLDKIKGDFGDAYRFHNLVFTYEQPGKLHYETDVAGIHIAYTINGNRKYSSVPTMHVHQVEDVTNAPGKKNTLIDVGLIPPEVLDEDITTYVGTHGKYLVFSLKSNLASESAKDVIWMDPVTHITVRRYHYDRDGKLDKWFTYSDPVKVAPGIYVPTTVTVYNQFNELAAVSQYTNIKANITVDESLFDF